MNKNRYLPPFLFASLLLFALILRLTQLSFQPLWWDEGFSLYFATETPVRLLELTSLDIHPPLYYLLLQGWLATVGIGASTARGLSVLVGVVTLPLAWVVARGFVGARGAWWTLWLFAISPLHVYYSQEVRMYSLLVLWALLAVWAWQARRWLLLGLAVGLGLLTHYYFLFMALALALLIVAEWRKTRGPASQPFDTLRARGYEGLRGPLMAAFAALIVNVPWWLYALPRLYTYLEYKLGVEADTPMTPLEFLPRHLVAWSVGHLEAGWTWLAWGALLWVLLLLLGLYESVKRKKEAPFDKLRASTPNPSPNTSSHRHRRWSKMDRGGEHVSASSSLPSPKVGRGAGGKAGRHAREGRFRAVSLHRPTLQLLILWLVPTLCVFLVGLVAPFVAARIERQLLFVLPFFLMLVGQGVQVLWQHSKTGAWGVLALITLFNLTSLAGFYTVRRYAEEDYRPILADVGALQGPQDAWLAIYEWQIGYLRAYLPNAHPSPILIPGTTPGTADLISWVDTPEAIDEGVQGLLAQHERVWLPAYQVKGRLLEEEVARALTNNGVYARNDWYGNTRLYLFGKGAEVPTLEVIGEFDGVGEVRATAPQSIVASGTGIVPLFIEVDHMPEGIRISTQIQSQQSQRGGVWGEWDGALGEEQAEGENKALVDTLPDAQQSPEGSFLLRAGVPIDHGTPPGEYSVTMTLYRATDGQPINRVKDGIPTTPEATIGSISVVRPQTAQPAAALRRLANTSLDFVLNQQVELLGASLPTGDNETWQQGDHVPVTLLWQSYENINNEHYVFLQAIDKAGIPRALRDLPPVNGTFPTSAWQAGDLIRDPHQLYLPADMPAGEYRLITGLYDPNLAENSRLKTASGQDAFELGTIQVTERTRLLEEPSIGTPTNIPFGNRARLAQQQLPTALNAGQSLDLTLALQATQTGGTPLRIFAQFYHNEKQIYSSDHPLDPPASAWIEGEWIIDQHQLNVPNELEAGNYTLVVGIYEAESGVTLATPEGMWATVMEWEVGGE